ncbi:DUF2158 domain-containing protein [Duganella fentianensis]|uniref:YodC family protein n=1 Tax=Duganella fentianensis TaxID=2692177 RepID=UPI0032B2C681
MTYAYKVGDSVKLKAGGPVMSVQALPQPGYRQYYVCQWFAGKKLESGNFAEESLVAVTEPAA